MARLALHPSIVDDALRSTDEGSIYFAFCLGMALDLLSIYIGNSYLVSLLMMPIAAILTLKWAKQPLPWIVLVSVIAANPVNLNASVALNLIFAVFLVIFNMHYLNRVPAWLYSILFFAALSIIGSVVNWGTTGELFTHLAAIGNYIVGPFFLLPLIYFRLQTENNAPRLLKAFVLSLIVPSITFMFLARIFGSPELDETAYLFETFVNVSIYHLGNVDIYLTRTQAGIPLAAFICATFAMFVTAESMRSQLIAVALLFASLYLLLVTGSVGSSLAAGCGLAVILGIARRYTSIKKSLVILPMILGLAYAGWSQVPEAIKVYAGLRYEEKLAGGIDLSDRSERWKSALAYLLDNPEGRGWNLYVEPIGTYPHNDYLSYGIAFGIVSGLLYFFVPLKLLAFKVSKKIFLKNQAQVSIFLAGAGAVTVLFVNAFADHLTANRWYFNVIWSMIWFTYFAARAKIAEYANQMAER